MPSTTIIIPLSASSVPDDVEPVLSYCATTTFRCGKKPIAISGEARLISTLPESAHLGEFGVSLFG